MGVPSYGQARSSPTRIPPADTRQQRNRLAALPAATDSAYRIALTDWLACAAGGVDEPAAVAARTLGAGAAERAIAAGTAGHVLDFDDTYLPGLSHLSAPTAPAALVAGAHTGATVGQVLAGFAEGFEAMGALTAANHPDLRGRGWHPTAVCGTVGAAVAAARVLGADDEQAAIAARLAALRASGLRAAFGSDGKALQVGMAAAEGVNAARLAVAGARVPASVLNAPDGFEAAYGARWAEPGGRRAVSENWIKAYPCCLQTHSAIEAAAAARAADVPAAEGGTIRVHPVSLQAASLFDVEDGLQAKFSIPYLTAYTLLNGPPAVDGFRAVDERARELARERIALETDESLLESEAVLVAAGSEFRVAAALGSPVRPMTESQLAGKVRALAGARLDGVLDDAGRPADGVLAAVGL
jgi:2-methylcitrate dehydratase PrpD